MPGVGAIPLNGPCLPLARPAGTCQNRPQGATCEMPKKGRKSGPRGFRRRLLTLALLLENPREQDFADSPFSQDRVRALIENLLRPAGIEADMAALDREPRGAGAVRHDRHPPAATEAV